MKFSVADRLYLLSLDTFPQTGTFLKMGVLKHFMEALQFKVEELEAWELKEDENEKGKIVWNSQKAGNLEYGVSETLIGMVEEARDKSENIPLSAIPTFAKFDELKVEFAKLKEAFKDASSE